MIPDHRRKLVNHLGKNYDVSEWRTFQILKFHRSFYRYRTKSDNQAILRLRIKENAAVRVRYGFKCPDYLLGNITCRFKRLAKEELKN